MYMKSLRWALAVMAVLLAGSTVATVALASRAGARCRPCPQGWMWSEEHCYYLSSEAQDWEASQAFCLAHHATLPLLSHTQDFLSRHLVNRRSWVGARRGPRGWHWIDGAPLAPQLVSPKQDCHSVLRIEVCSSVVHQHHTADLGDIFMSSPDSPLPLLPEEDEDNPGLGCGALEEGQLVALDCSSPRPWVCARETK